MSSPSQTLLFSYNDEDFRTPDSLETKSKTPSTRSKKGTSIRPSADGRIKQVPFPFYTRAS